MARSSVADVMTREVVTVRADTPYKQIVALLAEHSVSAVPVIDSHRHVLGVVSEADLLHKLEFVGHAPHIHLFERKRRREAEAKAASDNAADLMTSPAVTIAPSASLATAAKLMDDHRAKRLPVVDHSGELVGIVSRRDLLRVYLRADEALRQEIIDGVLGQTLWMPPDAIDVTVDRGVVSLSGTLERRSSITIVVRLVEQLSGVVDVHNNLTYRFDDHPERRPPTPSARDVLAP